MKLADLDLNIPEDEVQANIVEAVGYLRGYIVLQTNASKFKALCDAGIPDLIITHPSWPRACWFGLEVKTSKGRLTKEQKNLYNDDRIAVARSADEALAELATFAAKLSERMNARPRISAERFSHLLHSLAEFAVQAAKSPLTFVRLFRTKLILELQNAGVDVERK